MICQGIGKKISPEEAIKVWPEGAVCFIRRKSGDTSYSEYLTKLPYASGSVQRDHFVQAGLPNLLDKGAEIFILTEDEIFQVAHQAITELEAIRKQVL